MFWCKNLFVILEQRLILVSVPWLAETRACRRKQLCVLLKKRRASVSKKARNAIFFFIFHIFTSQIVMFSKFRTNSKIIAMSPDSCIIFKHIYLYNLRLTGPEPNCLSVNSKETELHVFMISLEWRADSELRTHRVNTIFNLTNENRLWFTQQYDILNGLNIYPSQPCFICIQFEYGLHFNNSPRSVKMFSESWSLLIHAGESCKTVTVPVSWIEQWFLTPGPTKGPQQTSKGDTGCRIINH